MRILYVVLAVYSEPAGEERKAVWGLVETR